MLESFCQVRVHRHCEDRSRRSNPFLLLVLDGLLRFARNDDPASVARMSEAISGSLIWLPHLAALIRATASNVRMPYPCVGQWRSRNQTR